jgi:hypothetical protein
MKNWMPTIGIWVVTLVLSVVTMMLAEELVPKYEPSAPARVLVAFVSFLVVFGIRKVWNARGRRGVPK